jgi:hypothetical protein
MNTLEDLAMRTRTVILLFATLGATGCGPTHSSPDAGTPDAGGDAGSPEGGACADAGSGSWGTQPIQIDTAGLNADAPRVGVDAAGNAVALWQQTDGAGKTTLWSSRRSLPMGTWDMPVQIDTAATNGTSVSAQLAVSANGTAAAVWQEQALPPNAADDFAWANVYTPGKGWGTAAPLFQESFGGNATPQVAIDSKGNAVAAWAENIGDTPSTGQQAYASFYTSGAGWSAAVRVSIWQQVYTPSPPLPTHTTGSVDDVHVAINDAGDAVVTWWTPMNNISMHGIGNKPLAARYDHTTKSFGTPVFLDNCQDNCGSFTSLEPRVTLDANGNAVVIWHQQLAAGSGERVWAAHYTASTGTWSSPADALDASLMTVQSTAVPRVGFDPSGRALAVWQQTVNQGDPSLNTMVSNFFSGGAWKGPVGVDVTEPGLLNSSTPEMAFDDGGNAFVVWSSTPGPRAAFWNAASARFDSDTVIAQDSISGQQPQVAFTHGACPIAVAVWIAPNGNGTNNVFSTVYR